MSASTAPPGAVGDLPLVFLDEVVQLDEIDVVDAEALEGTLEAGAGSGTGAVRRLRGEEELAAVLRHPRRQAELGVTVVSRRVEVVDAELEQRRQQLIGTLLSHGAEGGRPEDDPATGVSGPAEGCGVDVPRLPPRRFGHPASGTPAADGPVNPTDTGGCQRRRCR